MMTGTNPGKHGVFHFCDLQAPPSQKLLVNATLPKGPSHLERVNRGWKEEHTP